jgi:hypothetical protein
VTTEASLIWGVLFGSIGLAYFTYGRRQQKMVPLFSGVGLIAITFFVGNVYLLVGLGVVLMALPYFIRQ